MITLKRNGFTLIEVIVAVGVFGILSLGIFTVLGNNFSFLKESRAITGDTFLSQQDIELELSALKTQLKDSSHGLTLGNVVIDGVSVDYYEVSKVYNGTTYQYRVTPQQDPEYILLKTFNADATLKSNNISAFSVYPINTSTVVGSNTPDAATYSTHWMMDVHQWYVSIPGFNVPVPKGPVTDSTFKFYNYLVSKNMENELGTRYPIFPDDYILIGTATTNSIPDLTPYAGRHLVYKVTPAAKSGRLGIPEFSDPIFINGLPYMDGLTVHLDANTIDASYKDISNNAHVDADGKVISWFDLSSGIGVAIPTQSASNSTALSRPLLNNTDMDVDYKGKYVDFNTTTLLTLNNQSTSGKYIYGYAVVRGTEGAKIFSNGLSTNINLDATSTNIQNGWRIQKFAYLSGNNTFTFGLSDMDVAEVVIYAFSSQLTPTQVDNLDINITSYLFDKYVPLEMNEEIDHLIPQNYSVFKNDPFTAPASVPAVLVNGLSRYVRVTWQNNGVIVTSKVGPVTISGHATEDSSKTVTLIVEVKPIPVSQISLSISDPVLIVGNPNTITATVIPENADNKTLSWSTVPASSTIATVNSATVNSAVVTPLASGTVTIRATSVSDPTVYGEITITVKSQEDLIRDSIISKLESINELTVNNPRNRNNDANSPTIITPVDVDDIIFTFKDASSTGSASITISSDLKSAKVLRESRDGSNQTGSIVLVATKGTVILEKPFKVTIPKDTRNNGSLPNPVTAVEQ